MYALLYSCIRFVYKIHYAYVRLKHQWIVYVKELLKSSAYDEMYRHSLNCLQKLHYQFILIKLASSKPTLLTC